MKTNKKLYSAVLASVTVILFFILLSSTVSAATAKSAEPVNTYAYIANAGSNTVSVIDTATNAVTATVPVGNGPFAVAVNPGGTNVYVTNINDAGVSANSVSVIDTALNKVTAIVSVGRDPTGIAVTPDGSKVYVANVESYSVSVIDTATNTVVGTVNELNFPAGIAVNPKGTKVYVTNNNDNSVSVIDTTTNTVISTVKVGIYPIGIAVNPTGTKVYVVNSGSNTVSVIDTTTNTVTANVSVGSRPVAVSITPDERKVYVTNSASNTVSVINTTTNAVTANVSVGSQPYGVSVTPNGTKIYVTNWGSNTTSIIDTATDKVKATVDVGVRPSARGQFIGSIPVKPVPPVANFSSNVDIGYSPLYVQFTDLSDNATGWNWDFGDGTYSTYGYTTHVYTIPGVYTVNLTVSNANGKDSKSAAITVLEKPVLPFADFSASPTKGKVPLTVKFTAKSTGSPTLWTWDFGDGITLKSKISVNPVHKYDKAGDYTVSLTVENKIGSDEVVKFNYVTVGKK